jgi:hypothetical protein
MGCLEASRSSADSLRRPARQSPVSRVRLLPRRPSTGEFFGSIEAEAKLGKDVPGPGHYAVPPTMAVTGRTASLKGRTFFGSIDAEAAKLGKGVPGPGAYAVKDTPFTRREPVPQAPALKSRVEPVLKPAHDIGPGHYAAGLQADRLLSSRASTRAISFGAPAPEARRNSLPPALAATAHLGPGVYFEALNADVRLSTSPPVRTCSLGGKPRPATASGARGSAGAAAAPPEPAMVLPSAGVGPQPLSTKRTAPAPSFKGRTRFGSPYNF